MRRAFIIEVEVETGETYESLPEDLAAWLDYRLTVAGDQGGFGCSNVKDLYGERGCRVFEVNN